MFIYKDPKGMLHNFAVDIDTSVDEQFKDLIKLTPKELDDLKLKNEKDIIEQEIKHQSSIEYIRDKRDSLLLATDWTQYNDCPLDKLLINKYKEYRQALRDITKQKGDIVWPIEPK